MSEIAYLGKPSVLIPSPNVAENHQEKNADAAVKAGAAVKISEKDLTEESLERVLNRLLGDKAALEKMAECSAKSGVRDSDTKILNVIEELVL